MFTGSKYEMEFVFTIIKAIADITLKLINQVRVEHFIDLIIGSKQRGKFGVFLTEKLPST